MFGRHAHPNEGQMVHSTCVLQAIIVEAYVEVKEATQTAPGIFEEAKTLLLDYMRHVTGAVRARYWHSTHLACQSYTMQTLRCSTLDGMYVHQPLHNAGFYRMSTASLGKMLSVSEASDAVELIAPGSSNSKV